MGALLRPRESMDFEFPFAKAELCLNVVDHADEGIGLMFEYDNSLFAASTVDRYLAALEKFAKSPIAWSES
ncbi:hypothetical protein ACKWRH_45340 (plasmid) [Bradyrhizobium sp. Pa8]|uniref:hypothetical protein n=1 Tax=Bradyrhizobium sp. Pa8 TaxID=3386552 RepID=UPI00403EFDBD